MRMLLVNLSTFLAVAVLFNGCSCNKRPIDADDELMKGMLTRCEVVIEDVLCKYGRGGKEDEDSIKAMNKRMTGRELTDKGFGSAEYNEEEENAEEGKSRRSTGGNVLWISMHNTYYIINKESTNFIYYNGKSDKESMKALTRAKNEVDAHLESLMDNKDYPRKPKGITKIDATSAKTIQEFGISEMCRKYFEDIVNLCDYNRQGATTQDALPLILKGFKRAIEDETNVQHKQLEEILKKKDGRYANAQKYCSGINIDNKLEFPVHEDLKKLLYIYLGYLVVPVSGGEAHSHHSESHPAHPTQPTHPTHPTHSTHPTHPAHSAAPAYAGKHTTADV